jgi:polysaccharide biosynthesis protein PslG
MRAWQIWNEQNSPKYYSPVPNPRDYARLVAASAGAIRSVRPKVDVILGGMWGPAKQKQVVPVARFLRGVYRHRGAAASFDGLAVHPYHRGVGGMLRQVYAVKRAARSAGDKRAAIWVTELGWASTGPKGHRLVRGRKGQARILKRAYQALAKRRVQWRVRGVYWYAWTDAKVGAAFVCKWCPGAGLRTADGKPKPAWREMKRVARRDS